MRHLFCLMLAISAGTAALTAQMSTAPQLNLPSPPAPAPASAAAPPQTPPPAATPPSPQTQPAIAPLSDDTPFELNDASLTEMIRILAKRLKINYILDPSVKGTVTIYTYGE